VVDLAVLGLWLDLMLIKVLSNLNDCMIPQEHTAGWGVGLSFAEASGDCKLSKKSTSVT